MYLRCSRGHKRRGEGSGPVMKEIRESVSLYNKDGVVNPFIAYHTVTTTIATTVATSVATTVATIVNSRGIFEDGGDGLHCTGGPVFVPT